MIKVTVKVKDTHPNSEALGFPGDRIRYVCKKSAKKDVTLIYDINDVIWRRCIYEQKQ